MQILFSSQPSRDSRVRRVASVKGGITVAGVVLEEVGLSAQVGLLARDDCRVAEAQGVMSRDEKSYF